jgi:hypothetical protein
VDAGRRGGHDGVFELILVFKGAATVFTSHTSGVLTHKSSFEVVPGTDDGCAEVKIF